MTTCSPKNMEDKDEIPDLVNVPGEVKELIPITILTGFLVSGKTTTNEALTFNIIVNEKICAGKTTLLNYILTQNHGYRIAVIENEFSSGLNIEGMIARNGVDGSSLAGFFELNNGCICCSMKGDLVSTLEQLVLHKNKFDYVIIETTGGIFFEL